MIHLPVVVNNVTWIPNRRGVQSYSESASVCAGFHSKQSDFNQSSIESQDRLIKQVKSGVAPA